MYGWFWLRCQGIPPVQWAIEIETCTRCNRQIHRATSVGSGRVGCRWSGFGDPMILLGKAMIKVPGWLAPNLIPAAQSEMNFELKLQVPNRIWLKIPNSIKSSWWSVDGFTYLYFHPYLGKWSILTNIFQMGWKHHLIKWWSVRFSCFFASHKNTSIFAHSKLRSSDLWQLIHGKPDWVVSSCLFLTAS